MTNNDLDRISRSWAGHLATTPELRGQMEKAKSDEAMADLINQTVVPKDNVSAEHVPTIQRQVNQMFAVRNGGDTALQFHGKTINPS
jgi:polysaccharide pyruvyl transferase WcaK-like protein